MKKLSLMIAAACIAAAVICGCGNKEAAQTTTAAATAAAETQTTAAPSTEATTEATTEAATEEETEEVVESITTYENSIFSLTYPAGLFTDDSENVEDAVFFTYTGNCKNPVFLEFVYVAADPADVAETTRNDKDAKIMVDETAKPSFWPEKVSIIQQSLEEDGYTAYHTSYFLPYEGGTLTMIAVDYKDDDEEVAMEISDAMEALINSLKFKN